MDDTTNEAKNLIFHQPLECCLGEVLEALEVFTRASEKLPASDAHPIHSAIFVVHKQVTALAYRIGQIEKPTTENRGITTNQATVNVPASVYSQDIQPTTISTPSSHRNPLFSEMVKSTKSFIPASNNPVSKPNIREWKTPPLQTKHESLIKIKDQNDSRLVLQEVKKSIIESDMEKDFKRVQQLQNGALIIECKNAVQQQKLNENLAKKDIEIKNLSNNNPMLMITGIHKGYEKDDFIKEFIAENVQITERFGPSAADMFTFVTKRECRNEAKENWVFQTPPQLFKWLIKNNTLSFDLSPAYVQEYANVVMCYKCCLFGHVSKYCKGTECCYKCGEAHSASVCNKSVYNCVNCSKLKLTNRDHSARDRQCPVFSKRLLQKLEHTNYTEADVFL